MNHITDDAIIDYLHHECSDDLDARIFAHLSDCRDCRERCELEASFRDRLRAAARADEREFPSLIKAGVWAAIGSARPTTAQRIRAFLSPALAVPFAVAVAVLVYFGVPVIRANQAAGSPTVAATYYFEEHAAEGQENPLADHASTSAALAFGSPGVTGTSPLIDAADAATLDDVVASRR